MLRLVLILSVCPSFRSLENFAIADFLLIQCMIKDLSDLERKIVRMRVGLRGSTKNSRKQISEVGEQTHATDVLDMRMCRCARAWWVGVILVIFIGTYCNNGNNGGGGRAIFSPQLVLRVGTDVSMFTA